MNLEQVAIEDDREALQGLVKEGQTKFLKWLRMTLCYLVHGGHELYRAHSEDRVYQECLCGYKTNGWKIDRRDRKLHLVRR